MPTTEQVLQRHAAALMSKANVHMVAPGTKIINGEDTGVECVVCFVSRKVPIMALAASDLIPAQVEDTLTDVIVATPFEALRPIPATAQVLSKHIGGASLGHYKITAGTWGDMVRDADSGEAFILSNAHVLANVNDGLLGDPVLCPGPFDGGTVAHDAIGELARTIHIYMTDEQSPAPEPPPEPPQAGCSVFAPVARLLAPKPTSRAIQSEPYLNVVDCALARFWPGVTWWPGIEGIGEVKGVNADAVIGLAVRKNGRTTGLTSGRVAYTGAIVDVGYGSGRTARFTNQIVIVGDNGDFSAGGDSGSVIVDGLNQATALLFAGSDTYTIANPITTVMSALNIRF